MHTPFTRGPGLYWRDEIAQAKPKQGSGIPGFVGCAVAPAGTDTSGLLETALTFTRQDELASQLGGIAPDVYLEAAVRGFFENGGKLCYVVVVRDTWSRLADAAERLRLMKAALDLGLQRLGELEDVDLIAAPYLVGLPLDRAGRTALFDLQKRLLDHCVDRGDCFAILDAPGGELSMEELTTQWDTLASHPGAANGALYYPWVKVPDSCLTCQGSGRSYTGGLCMACDGTGAISVPPSGHLAGIYARSDERVGVFRAPANESIEGIIDLDRLLSGAEQAALSDTGINLLRAFTGRGLRVWGARTLSLDRAWQWISVRRLFLSVARWLERSMANVVFEPNDLKLWIRIDRELTAYFDQLYRAGALKGREATDAYFVRCNEETNPPEVRAQGRLVVEIGLSPTVPREFIVVRLVRGADSISLTT